MALLSAARGVSQVMNRCEDAKTSGYLDLSDCMLMYIADAIYLVLKGYDVNKCSLKNNNLKKFPKKMIEKFPSMIILNAEGNEIEEIPDEMSSWTQMKGINLSRNKISEIPVCIFGMKNLAILDLSMNNIQDFDVPRLFSELPKLKQLNLTGNPVASVKKDEIISFATTDLVIKLE
uniref:Uncharacterized protein n=1 Tax=Acrobeloides nanus TaxID=290746 RepID=A0A914CW63_9BILA